MTRLFKHLFFWAIIICWTIPIFNVKGMHAWEFFQFNVLRLPIIAAATYLLIYHLLPRYLFQQKDIKKFSLAFICLFIATNLLDRWFIGTNLIDSVMGDTGLTYTFFNEIPLFRNAFILFSIMTMASLYQFFRWQQQLELKLANINGARVVLPTLKQMPTTTDEFHLKSGNSIHKLNWEAILYLEKDENYVVYHTAEKKYLERTTLSKLEKVVPSYFCRVHRSFIISTHQISKLESRFVEIKGQKIPIGRTYGKPFLDQLNLNEKG